MDEYEAYKKPKFKKLSGDVSKRKKKTIVETIAPKRMPKLNTKPKGRFHQIAND